VGHPLIHLGYAYELNNRQVGIESLAQIASNFDFTFDEEEEILIGVKPSQATSVTELLREIETDKRFDGVFKTPGGDNATNLMRTKKAEVLGYVSRFTFPSSDDAKADLNECFKLAAMLLCSPSASSSKPLFDFFLCHVLTTLHAVRILLPIVPPKYQVSLITQWWFLVVKVYISQLRPTLNDNQIIQTELNGRDWDYIVEAALSGNYSTDAHYVKGMC
jgi:hypothetical protein